MNHEIEQLAADFPGWRIESSASGTGYVSAHRGQGEDALHLGSPSVAGLRRMLTRRESGTLGDLGAQIAEAGY